MIYSGFVILQYWTVRTWFKTWMQNTVNLCYDLDSNTVDLGLDSNSTD